MERNTKQPWGHAQVLLTNSTEVIRVIFVNPGATLQIQPLRRNVKTWFVTSGEAWITVGQHRRAVGRNHSAEIPAGIDHGVSNQGSQTLCMVEVQRAEDPQPTVSTGIVDEWVKTAPGPSRISLRPPVVVCEIGCNHKGGLDIALEMIKVAAQFCKVDVVKFQKRDVPTLLSPEERAAPHPSPFHAYGATYGEHREMLELDQAQHRVLMRACEDWGVVYSTSVWDLTSAREIVALGPQLLKIPSPINTNYPVLSYVFHEFEGDIHISLGMTTRREETRIVELAEKHGRLKDVVLYHCISAYPVAEKDLCLLELRRLVGEYGARVKAIGFSGHQRGIAPDIAALTLGAEYFERHFTLDRAWKGTDHAASLEPDGMRRLARDLREVATALRYKEREIAEVEEEQRRKLKRIVELED